MNSMTGFGRSEFRNDSLVATVEISSVNRKQADVQVSLPRHLAELEATARKTVLEQVSRGSVRVSITVNAADSEGSLALDLAKVKALRASLKTVEAELGCTLVMTTADILAIPEVFTNRASTVTVTEAEEVVEGALSSALTAFLSMRSAEGDDLKADTAQRLQSLSTTVAEIEILAPSVTTHHRETLLGRLKDINIDLDLADDRIIREIALFTERADITEEITRLHAHLTRFTGMLDSTEPIGRSLDFLCQEIHREFNTIGSKANSSDIAQHVVSGKTELEKIREQIQNVE